MPCRGDAFVATALDAQSYWHWQSNARVPLRIHTRARLWVRSDRLCLVRKARGVVAKWIGVDIITEASKKKKVARMMSVFVLMVLVWTRGAADDVVHQLRNLHENPKTTSP